MQDFVYLLHMYLYHLQCSHVNGSNVLVDVQDFVYLLSATATAHAHAHRSAQTQEELHTPTDWNNKSLTHSTGPLLPAALYCTHFFSLPSSFLQDRCPLMISIHSSSLFPSSSVCALTHVHLAPKLTRDQSPAVLF